MPALTWAFLAERVTGIEPALSDWELFQDHGLGAGERLTWHMSVE
ncbi:hypothetical protein [Nonomuraea angiospora]